MNSIGDILAKARKSKHLSQPKVAEELNKMGIDKTNKTISAWEKRSGAKWNT